MFSVKTLMFSAALSVVGLTAVAPEGAQAGVVVKSSGPSAGQFPVGKKVDDNGRITLKSGDKVTVLSNGTTRVISGPGTHRVSARGSSRRAAFRTLTQQRSASRARVGASRGDSTMSMTSPNLWWVDVSQSGTMCVSDLSAVRMWRPGMEGASTYVFASAISTDHIHVSFPDGQMTTAWDAERMPLTEGASYMITGPGDGAPQEMNFATIATPPATAEALAEVLIEKGCNAQLELLTETLK